MKKDAQDGENLIGSRVMIQGNHPWKGEAGTIISHGPPQGIRVINSEEYYTVELDNDIRCFAMLGDLAVLK